MAKAQFEREYVIDQTIKLFWQNGYSGSSMQQVVKATGLKPGSIYLAFGSKEGLFKEAIESYATKNMVYIKNHMDSSPSVGEGICSIFKSMINDSTRKQYNSCLLIKTRLEMGSSDTTLDEFAGDKLKDIEVLIQYYLEKDYDSELSKRRAISVVLHFYGIRVYGYNPNSAEDIYLGLREGLPWLPWDSTEST